LEVSNCLIFHTGHETQNPQSAFPGVKKTMS